MLLRKGHSSAATINGRQHDAKMRQIRDKVSQLYRDIKKKQAWCDRLSGEYAFNNVGDLLTVEDQARHKQILTCPPGLYPEENKPPGTHGSWEQMGILALTDEGRRARIEASAQAAREKAELLVKELSAE